MWRRGGVTLCLSHHRLMERTFVHVRRALLAKNKLKFINGTVPKPAIDNPLHDTWERSNTMVVSWINQSLTVHIAQSTVYFDNARSLWLDLLDRYSKGNHFRISDILQDMHSMKQGDRTISTSIILIPSHQLPRLQLLDYYWHLLLLTTGTCSN